MEASLASVVVGCSSAALFTPDSKQRVSPLLALTVQRSISRLVEPRAEEPEQ